MCGYTKETFIPKVKVALDMSLSSQIEARPKYTLIKKCYCDYNENKQLWQEHKCCENCPTYFNEVNESYMCCGCPV